MNKINTFYESSSFYFLQIDLAQQEFKLYFYKNQEHIKGIHIFSCFDLGNTKSPCKMNKNKDDGILYQIKSFLNEIENYDRINEYKCLKAVLVRIASNFDLWKQNVLLSIKAEDYFKNFLMKENHSLKKGKKSFLQSYFQLSDNPSESIELRSSKNFEKTKPVQKKS